MSRTWMAVLLAVCGCAGDTRTEETSDAVDTSEVSEVGYFAEGLYIREDARANVVRRIEFLLEQPKGVSWGFDLDGETSSGAEQGVCGHPDLVDPEGATGIDNQLAVVWAAGVGALVGEAVTALLQGAINEGRFLLMIELDGLDDLSNDEEVTVRLYHTQLDPEIGTQGLIAPDQTFYFDYEEPVSTVPSVRLEDGELTAGPISFSLPIEILDASFILDVLDGVIRVEIRPDGTFHGIIGGAVVVDDVIGDLLETNAAAETELVAPIFQDNADMGFIDGHCTRFSLAVAFEGTRAFVVRDAAQE